jgi:hypothetical protein
VNVIGTKGEVTSVTSASNGRTKTSDEIAAEQQKRFKEMRERLLTQDARTD